VKNAAQLDWPQTGAEVTFPVADGSQYSVVGSQNTDSPTTEYQIPTTSDNIKVYAGYHHLRRHVPGGALAIPEHELVDELTTSPSGPPRSTSQVSH
jgi:hypothetical protein